MNLSNHKIVASVVSASLIVTNILGASAEASFWAERKAKSNPPLLASLPLPAQQRLSAIKSPADAIPAPLFVSTESGSLDSLLKSIPQQAATVRDIEYPRQKSSKTVVLINDIHLNPEAQFNIAKTIEAISTQTGIVALEGIQKEEKINLSPIRRHPYKDSVKAAADFLLKTQKISGAIHMGLTTAANPPLFVGVDDAARYKANVNAYLTSSKSQAAIKKELSAEKRKLNAEKNDLFNDSLKAFDQKVSAYREESLSLQAYIAELKSRIPADTFEYPAIETFSEALEVESKLDFAKVESERAQLLEALLPKLNQKQSDQLVSLSLAYRLGQISHHAFYSHIQTLCNKSGVTLARFPQMSAYVQYVLLTEAIKAEKLLAEISAAEKSAYAAAIQTAAEKSLVEQSNQLYLTEKLVRFELTQEEWKEYRAFANNQKLKSFEDFYINAESRNSLISNNLIEAMKSNNQSTAVLVAGGFHSEGITTLLTKAGATVVNVTPRLTKIDQADGTAYLSVFSQQKTPLQKLVTGEKLFVAPHSYAPGVAQGDLPTNIIAFDRIKDRIPEDATELFIDLNDEAVRVEKVTAEKLDETHLDIKLEDGDKTVSSQVEIKDDQIEGNKSQRGYLTKHEAFADNFGWAYHVMLFTGIASFIFFNMDATLGAAQLFIVFLKKEVAISLLFALIVRHTTISLHEIGHYVKADRVNQLSSADMRVMWYLRPQDRRQLLKAIGKENFVKFKFSNFYNRDGKLKELTPEMKKLFVDTLLMREVHYQPPLMKKVRFWIKAFIQIPFGKFAPIHKSKGLLRVSYKVQTSGSNIDIEAAGPAVSRLIFLTSFVPGLVLFATAIGIAYFLPHLNLLHTAELLSDIGRPLLTMGFVGGLNMGADDNAYYEAKKVRLIREQRAREAAEKSRALEAQSSQNGDNAGTRILEYNVNGEIIRVPWNSKAMLRKLDGQRILNIQFNGRTIGIPWQWRNVFHGGEHAKKQGSNISIQEFMIVPLRVKTTDPTKVLKELQSMCLRVQNRLQDIAQETDGINFLGTGKEGGVVATVPGYEDQVLEIMIQAMVERGYTPGVDFAIALDVAASEMNHGLEPGQYKFNRRMHSDVFDSERLIDKYEEWVNKYPIISIEDGLAEDDYNGWNMLADRLGDRIDITGDDLTTTNEDILKEVVVREEIPTTNGHTEIREKRVIDFVRTVLIKMNQIGTLTETLRAMAFVERENKKNRVSHRSGDTEDTSVVDIALGTNAESAKMGGAKGQERVAKWRMFGNRAFRFLKKLLWPSGAASTATTISKIIAYPYSTNDGVSTVKVEIWLSNGSQPISAAVPIGASAGTMEALQRTDKYVSPRTASEFPNLFIRGPIPKKLKDNQHLDFHYFFRENLTREEVEAINNREILDLWERSNEEEDGKGVQNAVDYINNRIAPLLEGVSLRDLGTGLDIDQFLLALEQAEAYKQGLLLNGADHDTERIAMQGKRAGGMNSYLPLSLALWQVIAARDGEDFSEFINKEFFELVNNDTYFDENRQALYSGDNPYQLISMEALGESEIQRSDDEPVRYTINGEDSGTYSLLANMFTGRLYFLNYLTRIIFIGGIVPHEFGHLLVGPYRSYSILAILAGLFYKMPWKTVGPEKLAGLVINLAIVLTLNSLAALDIIDLGLNWSTYFLFASLVVIAVELILAPFAQRLGITSSADLVYLEKTSPAKIRKPLRDRLPRKQYTNPDPTLHVKDSFQPYVVEAVKIVQSLRPMPGWMSIVENLPEKSQNLFHSGKYFAWRTDGHIFITRDFINWASGNGRKRGELGMPANEDEKPFVRALVIGILQTSFQFHKWTYLVTPTKQSNIELTREHAIERFPFTSTLPLRQLTKIFENEFVTKESAASEEIKTIGEEMGLTPREIKHLTEPDRVFRVEIPIIRDNGQRQTFVGWRAHYNDALGPNKGGLRDNEEMDAKWSIVLAGHMAWKAALMNLQKGGAKGGIRQKEKLSPREKALLRRGFIDGLHEFREPRAIGPYVDSMAPDMGTDENDMAIIVDQFIRLETLSGKLINPELIRILKAELKTLISIFSNPKFRTRSKSGLEKLNSSLVQPDPISLDQQKLDLMNKVFRKVRFQSFADEQSQAALNRILNSSGYTDLSKEDLTTLKRVLTNPELVQVLSFVHDPQELPYAKTYLELEKKGEVEGDDLAVVTGKPVDVGGIIGRKEATGKGVALIFVEAVRRYIIKKSRELGQPLQEVTVAIQGFGNVSSHAAKFISELEEIDGVKIKIVGISEINGFAANPNGLDIEALTTHFGTHKTFAGFTQSDSETIVETGSTVGNKPLFMDVDVLIPGAKQNEIHEENVMKISKRVKLILEAANQPVTSDAERYLRTNRQDITLVPGGLVNAGGVTVSDFEWKRNLGLLEKDITLPKIWSLLEGVMVPAAKELFDTAESKGITLIKAELYVAIQRVRSRNGNGFSNGHSYVDRVKNFFAFKTEKKEPKTIYVQVGDDSVDLQAPAELPGHTPLMEEFLYRYVPWVIATVVPFALALTAAEYGATRNMLMAIRLISFFITINIAYYISDCFFMSRHKIHKYTGEPYTLKQRAKLRNGIRTFNKTFITWFLPPAALMLIGASFVTMFYDSTFSCKIAMMATPVIAFPALLASYREHRKYKKKNSPIAPASIVNEKEALRLTRFDSPEGNLAHALVAYLYSDGNKGVKSHEIIKNILEPIKVATANGKLKELDIAFSSTQSLIDRKEFNPVLFRFAFNKELEKATGRLNVERAKNIIGLFKDSAPLLRNIPETSVLVVPVPANMQEQNLNEILTSLLDDMKRYPQRQAVLVASAANIGFIRAKTAHLPNLSVVEDNANAISAEQGGQGTVVQLALIDELLRPTQLLQKAPSVHVLAFDQVHLVTSGLEGDSIFRSAMFVFLNAQMRGVELGFNRLDVIDQIAKLVNSQA